MNMSENGAYFNYCRGIWHHSLSNILPYSHTPPHSNTVPLVHSSPIGWGFPIMPGPNQFDFHQNNPLWRSMLPYNANPRPLLMEPMCRPPIYHPPPIEPSLNTLQLPIEPSLNTLQPPIEPSLNRLQPPIQLPLNTLQLSNKEFPPCDRKKINILKRMENVEINVDNFIKKFKKQKEENLIQHEQNSMSVTDDTLKEVRKRLEIISTFKEKVIERSKSEKDIKKPQKSKTTEIKIETPGGVKVNLREKAEKKYKNIKESEEKRIEIKRQSSKGTEITFRKEGKKREYNMSRNHKDKYENSNPRRMYTLMCSEDYQSGKKSHWSELEITGSIRNLSPNLWQMTHLTALYLNDNSLQRVPPEIGRLATLRILDLSSNKLRSLPAELGDLIYLRELLLNQNFLRVLPYELGKLFQLQVLGLQGNPLSKEVMALYGNGEPAGTNKLLTYMLDNLQVTANHPPQRPWIPLTRPNRTRPTCIFTVMCYNVLCDKYATRQMYGYCPSWALDWEYRKKGILDEIRHYAADIISLQEVETDQFYNFFLPELKHDGYDGIFSPKSRAKTMAENDRKYVDGCAIFYRTAKFSLIKEHLVEFNQLAMANAEGSDNMLNRVMPKDNIGLAALLRTKEAAWDNGVPSDPAQVQQPILVCTAHIHWDPEFCDVKLIQTMMLSNELRSILDQAGQSFRPGHKPDSSNVQLLLCGDFNSLPDSGVIEFLTSGRVAADHRDFKDLAYKSCLQKISGCDKPNEFTHSFKLASAYSEDIMPYTNYTFEFKGIIDYIFYSKQSMVPLGLLGPLSPEWFKEHKVVGCPHPHVPSDHFPLLVELEMTPTVGTSNGLISRR